MYLPLIAHAPNICFSLSSFLIKLSPFLFCFIIFYLSFFLFLKKTKIFENYRKIAKKIEKIKKIKMFSFTLLCLSSRSHRVTLIF